MENDITVADGTELAFELHGIKVDKFEALLSEEMSYVVDGPRLQVVQHGHVMTYLDLC
jgi:hypothetical protein